MTLIDPPITRDDRQVLGLSIFLTFLGMMAIGAVVIFTDFDARPYFVVPIGWVFGSFMTFFYARRNR